MNNMEPSLSREEVEWGVTNEDEEEEEDNTLALVFSPKTLGTVGGRALWMMAQEIDHFYYGDNHHQIFMAAKGLNEKMTEAIPWAGGEFNTVLLEVSSDLTKLEVASDATTFDPVEGGEPVERQQPQQQEQQEQETGINDEQELDLIDSFNTSMPTTIPTQEVVQVSMPLGDVVARTQQMAQDQKFMKGERRDDQSAELKQLSEQCGPLIQDAMGNASSVADHTIVVSIKTCLETTIGIMGAMMWHMTEADSQDLIWTPDLLGKLAGRVVWFCQQPELSAKLNAALYKDVISAAHDLSAKLPGGRQKNEATFMSSKDIALLPRSNINVEDLIGGMNTDLQRTENVEKLHDTWKVTQRFIKAMRNGNMDVIFRNYEDLGEHITECNKILEKIEDMTPKEYADSGWDVDQLELLDTALWDIYSLKGNRKNPFDALGAWDDFRAVAGAVTWVREQLCQANLVDFEYHENTDQTH
jgi:hypothetical protein